MVNSRTSTKGKATSTILLANIKRITTLRIANLFLSSSRPSQLISKQPQSCKKFHDNEVRLQLHALIYNLATFLRCIELPVAMANWSLTSVTVSGINVPRVNNRARSYKEINPRIA